MIDAKLITDFQDTLTAAWHGDAALPLTTVVDPMARYRDDIIQHHSMNFRLWHAEDRAREPGATDACIASLKRDIDRYNQLRNDKVEALDECILGWLAVRYGVGRLPESALDAPLNSETPGLMIDRLSILALKIYHTREQVERTAAGAAHVQRNRERLSTLLEQRSDLASCLDALWQDVMEGKRRFKVYRQLKMYNDPMLNPAIYEKQGGTTK